MRSSNAHSKNKYVPVNDYYRRFNKIIILRLAWNLFYKLDFIIEALKSITGSRAGRLIAIN